MKKDGSFVYDQWISLDDITDGSSNTAIVGERPSPIPHKFGWLYAGIGQFVPYRSLFDPDIGFNLNLQRKGRYTGSLSATLGAMELNMKSSGYPDFDNCDKGPYSYSAGNLKNPCDAFHFWSEHPNGAQFLFGDGSVHFLNYSLGDDLVKLATRAGGEIPPTDW